MCIGGNQAFGITHTINFKTMTTINTELLDQKLNVQELRLISGGLGYLEPTTPEEEEDAREMEAWWRKRNGF